MFGKLYKNFIHIHAQTYSTVQYNKVQLGIKS